MKGSVSVLGAAEAAFRDVRERLFPLRFPYWLILGLVSFLDQCGSGSGSGFFPPNPGGGGGGAGGDGGEAFSQIGDWLGNHVGLVVLVALVVLTLIVAILVVTTWLSSRGVLMYVEAVATGEQPDLVDSFRRNAEAANSLFAWRFMTNLAATFTLLAAVVAGVALAVSLSRSEGGAAVLSVLGLVVVGLAVFVVAVGASLFSLTLRDLAAPLQWSLRVPCGEALQALSPALRRHWLACIGYVLGKLVVRGAMGVVVFMTCCLCCVGSLPVLSHTILQPFLFFERAFANRFLEELGFSVMRPLSPPALPGPPASG